jgi:hypothetical protein
MNAVDTDYKQLAEALEESNELLREELARLKKRNRVLMRIKSQLRSKIESLKHDKDDLFLAMCGEEGEDVKPVV